MPRCRSYAPGRRERHPTVRPPPPRRPGRRRRRGADRWCAAPRRSRARGGEGLVLRQGGGDACGQGAIGGVAGLGETDRRARRVVAVPGSPPPPAESRRSHGSVRGDGGPVGGAGRWRPVARRSRRDCPRPAPPTGDRPTPVRGPRMRPATRTTGCRRAGRPWPTDPGAGCAQGEVSAVISSSTAAPQRHALLAQVVAAEGVAGEDEGPRGVQIGIRGGLLVDDAARPSIATRGGGRRVGGSRWSSPRCGRSARGSHRGHRQEHAVGLSLAHRVTAWSVRTTRPSST